MTATPASFLAGQLRQWPMAEANFRALESVAVRRCGPAGMRVQFNPARAISTGARVDAASIKARPCFLCAANRPQEQIADWRFAGYELLVNPFPIFREHFTIAARELTPQLIAGRAGHMCAIAGEMPGYAVFYNGARCGASAPDHFHFQAVPADALPFLAARSFPFKVFTFSVSSGADADTAMSKVLDAVSRLPGQPACGEPMVNILAVAAGSGTVEFTVIPRRAHRPDFYGTGTGQMLVSPASVDLAGVMIVPREEDFGRLDDALASRILEQVCYPADAAALAGEPVLRVGIMEGRDIKVSFNGRYTRQEHAGGTVEYTPGSAADTFTLENVAIGKGFHWERTEPQTFRGALELRPIPSGGTLAVNIISLEEYLKSVISSEMSATASPALLRAHAIVSRSWLLAMLARRGGKDLNRSVIPGNPDEIVAWYDRGEHTLFDVCADDHCQRYQGITRQTSPAVAEAVEATRGQVLVYDGRICDARFSKCCGGRTEEFGACWGDEDHPYLQPVADRPADGGTDFCDTADETIITQVLNSYDREHTDFYRWSVTLDAAALPALLLRKTGIDFGPVRDLEPLQRGKSGRITRLLVRGERRSVILGKELEIRLALSESCLRSSAFDVEHSAGGFRLSGRGWGHGVGMCQIGAAVMGARGYSHPDILGHYFHGASITQLYD